MKSKYIILIAIASMLLTSSCAKLQWYFLFNKRYNVTPMIHGKQSKGYVIHGDNDSLINNAILNFSKSVLFRKDSVFYVHVNSGYLDTIPKVSIGGDHSKILLTKETTVGSKGKTPSKFKIVKGKLFHWRDRDYPLTQEALDVFAKYNILQDDEGGLVLLPDRWSDDLDRAAIYYFCSNDITAIKAQWITTHIKPIIIMTYP